MSPRWIHFLALLLLGLWPGALGAVDEKPPTPAKAPMPVPPPPAENVLSHRLKSLDRPVQRTLEVEGALARLRQRASARTVSQQTNRGSFQRDEERLSHDPATGRPSGFNLLMIKF